MVSYSFIWFNNRKINLKYKNKFNTFSDIFQFFQRGERSEGKGKRSEVKGKRGKGKVRGSWKPTAKNLQLTPQKKQKSDAKCIASIIYVR
jgi:hypothetical protein